MNMLPLPISWTKSNCNGSDTGFTILDASKEASASTTVTAEYFSPEYTFETYESNVAFVQMLVEFVLSVEGESIKSKYVINSAEKDSNTKIADYIDGIPENIPITVTIKFSDLSGGYVPLPSLSEGGSPVMVGDEYQGVTITHSDGLVIASSYGLTRVQLKSDTILFQARQTVDDDFVDMMYFDAIDGKLHVAGKIEGSEIEGSVVEGSTLISSSTGSGIGDYTIVIEDSKIKFISDYGTADAYENLAIENKDSQTVRISNSNDSAYIGIGKSKSSQKGSLELVGSSTLIKADTISTVAIVNGGTKTGYNGSLTIGGINFVAQGGILFQV